jgi:hypothetical protein
MKTVYFMRMGNGGPFKIGYTSNLKKRVVAISQGLPDHVTVEATIDGGREVELRIHRALSESRRRLEWFNPTDEVLALVSVAKLRGTDAVLRWLDAKEQSHRPFVAPAGDGAFDDELKGIIQLTFKEAVYRHGRNEIAAIVGKSVDAVEAYCSGKAVPNVVVLFRLSVADAGLLDAYNAFCARDAIEAQLAKLMPQGVRA